MSGCSYDIGVGEGRLVYPAHYQPSYVADVSQVVGVNLLAYLLKRPELKPPRVRRQA